MVKWHDQKIHNQIIKNMDFTVSMRLKLFRVQRDELGRLYVVVRGFFIWLITSFVRILGGMWYIFYRNSCCLAGITDGLFYWLWVDSVIFLFLSSQCLRFKWVSWFWLFVFPAEIFEWHQIQKDIPSTLPLTSQFVSECNWLGDWYYPAL